MKLRTNFVSNSSSASFVIPIDDITPRQKRALLNFNRDKLKGYDWWEIHEDESADEIRGFTVIDNGDLTKYMDKYKFNIDLYISDES